MANQHQDKDLEAGLPREPPQKYQVPDWEGAVNPPRTGSGWRQRPSFLDKLKHSSNSIKAAATNSSHFARTAATAATAASSTNPTTRERSSTDISRQTDPDALKNDKAGRGAGGVAPNPTTSSSLRAAETSTRKSPLAAGTNILSSCRTTFDRLLPPHRTYFGRSRKFFLLAILLPTALFFLLILPLALGLGLRGNGGGDENLPLPGSAEVHTGDITYYTPGLGACGWTSNEDDEIVAVSRVIWDAQQEGTDPNSNPLCGKKIRVQRDFVEEGKGTVSVDVKVVDRCVGCEAADLDLTLSTFEKLANEEQGRVTASWAWLD